MERIPLNIPGYPQTAEYRVSEQLTNLGGFVMVYGNQCIFTMSANLSPEERMLGIEYLRACLGSKPARKSTTHLWMKSESQSDSVSADEVLSVAE